MKTNTIIALAAGAAILACIKKQKGTSGVGKVDYSDFDGARIVAKDGFHAIEFNIYGGTGSGVVVSSMYKGKGKYGSIWEYLSHIGEYKTLAGAIKAAKKYWNEKGIQYNPKDFEQL